MKKGFWGVSSERERWVWREKGGVFGNGVEVGGAGGGGVWWRSSGGRGCGGGVRLLGLRGVAFSLIWPLCVYVCV